MEESKHHNYVNRFLSQDRTIIRQKCIYDHRQILVSGIVISKLFFSVDVIPAIIAGFVLNAHAVLLFIVWQGLGPATLLLLTLCQAAPLVAKARRDTEAIAG